MEFKPAAAPQQPSASKVAEVRKKGAKRHLFPTDPEGVEGKHLKSSQRLEKAGKIFLKHLSLEKEEEFKGGGILVYIKYKNTQHKHTHTHTIVSTV